MMRDEARAHYVYRCYQADGRLLYVGVTVNLAQRLASHRAKKHWAGDVVKVKAVVLPRDEAMAEESRAIMSERPRFNIVGRWSTRLGWTVEDYDDYLTALSFGPDADKPKASLHAANVRAIRDQLASRAA